MPGPLNPRRAPRRAFTLIEMMVALGLSVVILLTVVSAFRAASQTFTAAVRINRMNEMMICGVEQAFEEVDFWGSYDGDAAHQRLRQSMEVTVAGNEGAAFPYKARTVRLGLPFSPFRADPTGANNPAVWADTSYGGGWRDDEMLWAISADNELTWWPGNVAESQESDCRFGRYAIFGVSRLPQDPVKIDNGMSEALGGWQPRNGGGLYGTLPIAGEATAPAAYSAPSVYASYRHNLNASGWLYNQMHGLADGLGWYGMMDYLPPNAIDCYYGLYHQMVNVTDYNGSGGEATDAAGKPIYMEKTFVTGFAEKSYFLLQSFSPNWSPHAMDFLTSYTAYALYPPNNNTWELAYAHQPPPAGAGSANAPQPTLSTAELVYRNRDYIRMESCDVPIGDWGNNDTNQLLEPQQSGDNTTLVLSGGSAGGQTDPQLYTNYLKKTTALIDLAPIRPGNWPGLTVGVGRYLRQNRFTSLFKVTWTDPLTGEAFGLGFSAFGTTLRGARRQRSLDQ